jgi:GNAT superfamily N-acetyltransferase
VTLIRHLEPDDVDFALRQKAREGWAVSRDQFGVYLEHDPDGCFVAADSDRPVGMVTTTCFGPSGWIGNLIVEPDFRRRGVGRALMEHGLEHLQSRGTATIRLEGDPPGIPLYRRLGFVDEFESCRLVLATSIEQPPLDDSTVETMIPSNLDEVALLDAAVVGEDRRRFLDLKFSVAELALVRRRNGEIVASLMAALTDRGFRVGPGVALEAADARGLIETAIQAASGRPVLIGLPSLNTGVLAILAEMGFERRPSSLRMRLGPPTDVGDPGLVFAISSGATG